MKERMPKQTVKRRLSGILLFSSILLLTFCSKKDKDETAPVPSGRYVNQTFLGAIADSVPGLVPAYCYEINFFGADSAAILYGFETGNLAYKKEEQGYTFVKAMQDKDLKFKVNTDQTITIEDSSWNNNGINSVFKKSLNSTEQKWDFEAYLNQQMIAGGYTIYKNGKPTEETLSFKSDGSVSGIPGVVHYSICYSGDCVEEIYPISNSITFTNTKEESITYAFVKSAKGRTLKIYNVEMPIKDVKGERAIKDIVFDLRMKN